MNSTDEQAAGTRPIDAAEANRLAQELNDQATGTHAGRIIETENREPAEDTVDSQPVDAPVQSDSRAAASSLFPSDWDGNTTIGGDAESIAVLREEQSH